MIVVKKNHIAKTLNVCDFYKLIITLLRYNNFRYKRVILLVKFIKMG